MDTMDACNLLQFNPIPNNNNRFLDIVISTLPANSIRVETVDPICRLDQHHLAYQIDIIRVLKDNHIKPNKRKRFNFNKCDYIKVRSDLNSVNWDELMSSRDINTCVDIFYDRVNEIISHHTPFTRSFSHKYPPWYTPALILNTKH
jgi:hypothetical protein